MSKLQGEQLDLFMTPPASAKQAQLSFPQPPAWADDPERLASWSERCALVDGSGPSHDATIVALRQEKGTLSVLQSVYGLTPKQCRASNVKYRCAVDEMDRAEQRLYRREMPT